jgi:DNA-binding transcriptional LysR family regulator
VAEYAAEVLGITEHFSAQLHRRREGEGGTLRVGAIDAGSLYILPEALRRFRGVAPGVDLRLTVGTSAELEGALLRHELDLAFVIGDDHHDDRLRRESLMEEKLFLYGPVGRRKPHEDDDWVLYPAGSHTRDQIDRELAANGWIPRVRLESSNPQVLRQMVALGFGWSVLPRAVAESGAEPLKAARVRPVARRRIVASRRHAAGEDPRVEKFLELARAWMRREQRL